MRLCNYISNRGNGSSKTGSYASSNTGSNTGSSSTVGALHTMLLLLRHHAVLMLLTSVLSVLSVIMSIAL